MQVNAIDRDQGENAEFYYHINDENPTGAFVIDPRTGWITVRDQELLDREARPNILMSVQALEKKEPYDRRDYSAGTVNVEITLLDSNDNTPEFEMGNLYEFKCNIDAVVGHVVGHGNIFNCEMIFYLLINMMFLQLQPLILMKAEMV